MSQGRIIPGFIVSFAWVSRIFDACSGFSARYPHCQLVARVYTFILFIFSVHILTTVYVAFELVRSESVKYLWLTFRLFSLKYDTFADLLKLETLLTVGTSLNAVCDILITLAMIASIHTAKVRIDGISGKTTDMLNRLVSMSNAFFAFSRSQGR